MIWVAWGLGSVLLYWLYIRYAINKQLNQPIYEDSPQTHQAKVGTPTMGGLFIFISFILGMAIELNWSSQVVWVISVTTLFFLIGALDDICSLRLKNNKGLSAKQKFLLQIFVSVICVITLNHWVQPVSVELFFIYVFLLTGTSNATNLTDGLDGLLGSTMIISLIGVFLLFESLYMPEGQRMVLIMIVSIVIFLLFNWNPAKIFMGDVGSLMLGAFLASAVIISGKWPFLIGFGAIYVIETLSVICQVFWFKKFKKRIFLMTPLHHHFELIGLKETNVVFLFAALQALFTWIQI